MTARHISDFYDNNGRHLNFIDIYEMHNGTWKTFKFH